MNIKESAVCPLQIFNPIKHDSAFSFQPPSSTSAKKVLKKFSSFSFPRFIAITFIILGGWVEWLWEETHVSKVMGSNPNIVHWMDIISHLFVVKIVMMFV